MFRAAASHPPGAYNAALDYGSQMLSAAAMYGHHVPPTPSFAQSMRGNRREDLALPRSPMLDEFRATKGNNEFRATKGNKWELKVNQHFDLQL